MKKISKPKACTKVVVVDDYAVIREGLRLWLESMENVEVVGEAETAHDALDLVRAKRPDLVLLDLLLPDMNALEVLARMRQDSPDSKIIVLSAFSDEEYVQRALRLGANGYLVKDINLNDLALAVQTVSQGAMVLSPAASKWMGERPKASEDEDGSEALTPRQLEILKLIAEGHPMKSIAHALGISVKTVDMHKARLMRRLNVSNIPSLVRHAVRLKLITLDAAGGPRVRQADGHH